MCIFSSSKWYSKNMCMFCTTDSFKSLIACGPLCIRYKSGNYENFRNDIKSLLLYLKKHLIFQGTHLIQHISNLSTCVRQT
ncbi:unnamed protein product, partial [Vitis vinifera]|uniref:Uncharacterized protein n=1 Tax=Vitis vinifera TaxID=29760 RepID=D7UEF3_VITVI